jgi:perosamine synthetase
MAISRFRPSLSLHEAGAFLRGVVAPGGLSKDEFERAFAARYVPGQSLFLSPSGRVALCWILRALGLEKGDEVVTQAFNFAAVPSAILAAGGVPRFVDVGEGSFDIDPAALRKAVGPRTRAVLATHLYGNPAALDEIAEICASVGAVLLEDCAQATGATFRGRPVGTFGRASFFTYGPTKNFTLLGGGAAATSDPALATRIGELSAHNPELALGKTVFLGVKAACIAGASHPVPFNLVVFPTLRLLAHAGIDLVHKVMAEAPGGLGAIEDLPVPSRPMVAIGLSQLRRVDDLNRARAKNGWQLRGLLEKAPGLTLPVVREGSIFMSFAVFHPKREAFAEALAARGVDTDLGFMEDCASSAQFSAHAADCPNSRRAVGEVVHLPIHPYLTDRDVEHIARATEGALAAV